MLRQSASGGTKRSLGIARLSNSNFFPLSAGTGTWGMGRGTKSNSLSSISSSSDGLENPGVDPDYIMQLVNDVRKFADVLLHLKEAFRAEENQDCLHQVVHERLGELLRVLKAVIGKHQTLNSVDILSAAGTVIAKIKGEKLSHHIGINDLGLKRTPGFSLLHGGFFLFFFFQIQKSYENLSVECGGLVPEKDDLQGPLRAKEVDHMLLKNDSGIESALLYAKAWSKYTKALLLLLIYLISFSLPQLRNGLKMGLWKYSSQLTLTESCFSKTARLTFKRASLFSGDFKRRLPRTPSTGTMSSADDLDEREPPSPSDNDVSLLRFQQTVLMFYSWLNIPQPNPLLAINGIGAFRGIYRVNGAKSRVEKLCQAFENGKDLVELSDLYPHDISNVLKLYLRQLPEPLIQFRLYNEFIGLAKESQNVLMDEVDSTPSSPTADKRPPSIELNRVIFKIKDLLRQLPAAHYKTLQYLIGHLNRVTEKAEENKMTASNLGIIFGPTLMKPRQTDADVSLSSLVDYPYQARIVELLILHYEKVFDVPLSPLSSSPPAVESLPVEFNLNPEEKEAQLMRHSKSLVDIKESSKVYKRHSSIIPSTHLVDEVKDVKHKPEGREFMPAMVQISENLNGLPSESCLQEGQKPNLVFSRSNHGATKVQMRSPRPKLTARPISMPMERLLNPSQLNEKNSKNLTEQDQSLTIEETSETVKTFSSVSTYCRNTYIDTQSLRRTWDKQYKHYDITPRTAMIMANIPQEAPSSSGSTILPNKPYTIAVRPGRALKRDGNIFDTNSTTSAFRAPRTLQPPPGTFYKPPSGNKALQTADLVPNTCPATTNSTETRQSLKDSAIAPPESEATSTVSTAQPQSPSSSPENIGQSEAKPVYQRVRARRLQEFEHREAHFV
nr:PREDICTED: rho GTPase-activating protein 29 [Lepisosteus oculatus]